ncbi:uncharacterized protein HMPREF1541_09632 [Cyphellophora europaea CBS 101466]|uniref:Uncharacterized protein n=1 Tax=Cyphellophora europaea (strain CBS 101466) TaxID=1220924 RepID=W2SCZ7_CYPE1|nr:uncharacterized protein HMPREF1541_09632 [Cyphellophora europaea CBS 101466]ETN45799.1 hypothetical protein HMPREF1541_09632 [Cyphellophora europaea CBS 101466]
MSSPSATPGAGKPQPSANKGKPTYIASSGNVLETPPLSARFARFTDSVYNFLGLYIVSLFSLDAYAAAQNSQFNTVGRPNAYQERARWGGVNRAGNGGSGGGGSGWGSGGNNDGRGPGGGGGPARRLGRVDDVRGPECGSCQ